MRFFARSAILSVLFALIASFAQVRAAHAVPSFARKYGTSCTTCHTIFPVLNSFGEAFRRDGYRFPSQGGSTDSDVTKAEQVSMGQEEYKKAFPDAVWPGKIAKDVPLSVLMNGQVAVNLPGSDAKTAAGNTFTWQGLSGEFHLFGAGAFDDRLTYFAQLTIPDDGTIEIETAYLLWNDVVGPRHLVNIWAGRLMAPQINSFGLHSSYIGDAFLPAVSVSGLYNPSGSFALGQGHADGVEVNGIVNHRVNFSVGWLASSVASGFGLPNAEDAYVHVGVKSGGVALDGEGLYGPNAPDPTQPWAERAITLDAFVYHGLSLIDSGTGILQGGVALPVAQRDTFNAVGGSIRAQWDSLSLNSGIQLEFHAHPYPGSAGTDMIPGVRDGTNATSVVQYNELDYVVFPWFVPALRTEFTHTDFKQTASSGSLLRILPGVAMLARPNVKFVITGDLERASELPPAGDWSNAGGLIAPESGSKFEAEQILATAAVSF